MKTGQQTSHFTDTVEQTFVLSKTIAGFELPGTAENRRNGGICEIAAGTILKLCGRGFSEQAAKVFANGRHYFVFLRDIQPSET